MNIVQFSLLTLLTYVLQCNAQDDSCVTLLLGRIKALSPLVEAAQLGTDVAECQKSVSPTTVPLGPHIPGCVMECNAYRNPNAVPCMQACWAEGPHPSPACISVLVDIASIVATVGFPESKILIAFLDGLAFLQCIFSLKGDSGPPMTTSTSTTSSTSASSCSSTIAATITCSPGDVQPTVVPCACCFQNLCSQHPIQCSCLCDCTS